MSLQGSNLDLSANGIHDKEPKKNGKTAKVGPASDSVELEEVKLKDPAVSCVF